MGYSTTAKASAVLAHITAELGKSAMPGDPSNVWREHGRRYFFEPVRRTLPDGGQRVRVYRMNDDETASLSGSFTITGDGEIIGGLASIRHIAAHYKRVITA